MALYVVVVVGCNKVIPVPFFVATSFEECAKRLRLGSLSEKDMKEKEGETQEDDEFVEDDEFGYDYLLCQNRCLPDCSPLHPYGQNCSCTSNTYIVKCPDGEIAKMMSFVQRELVI